MANLKCSNCGSTFEKKVMREYGSLGLTHAGAGYGLVIWPFVPRVYAECPFCKQTEWLKVLPPWGKTQKNAAQSQRPRKASLERVLDDLQAVRVQAC